MVVLNKNESCDNVKMCKIKMSIKQPSFSYYALCHVLIKGDETKLSKRKSRQNLKHKYIVVRCVKKWVGLHGEPLHPSYLNLNWTEH